MVFEVGTKVVEGDVLGLEKKRLFLVFSCLSLVAKPVSRVTLLYSASVWIPSVRMG